MRREDPAHFIGDPLIERDREDRLHREIFAEEAKRGGLGRAGEGAHHEVAGRVRESKIDDLGLLVGCGEDTAVLKLKRKHHIPNSLSWISLSERCDSFSTSLINRHISFSSSFVGGGRCGNSRSFAAFITYSLKAAQYATISSSLSGWCLLSAI